MLHSHCHCSHNNAFRTSMKRTPPYHSRIDSNSLKGGRAQRHHLHEQAAAGSSPAGKRHIVDSRTAGVELPLAAALGSSHSSASAFPCSNKLAGLSGFTMGNAPPPEMPEKRKAQVIVTKQDGTQLVYHTNRRDALHQMLLGVGVLSTDSMRWMWAPNKAGAALVQFPTTTLRNNYFLVRAGEGQSEADNYVLTNTVYKTSMSSGLSSKGKAQVIRETMPALKALGACQGSCWLWPSITQRSYQTAEILGALMGLTRSRIVPEYSFLDPRGMGALEGETWDAALPQVNSGDLLSPEWRPPRGTDGTPNESISDVLVRVRQVLSITETQAGDHFLRMLVQYNGASVVIISPDSDNLSVLQAALLGLDLRKHAELGLRPGEVRAVQLATESPALYSGKVVCARPPNCL